MIVFEKTETNTFYNFQIPFNIYSICVQHVQHACIHAAMSNSVENKQSFYDALFFLTSLSQRKFFISGSWSGDDGTGKKGENPGREERLTLPPKS